MSTSSPEPPGAEPGWLRSTMGEPPRQPEREHADPVGPGEPIVVGAPAPTPPAAAGSSTVIVAGDGGAGWRLGPVDDPDRYELLQRRSHGGEGDLWLGQIDVDGVPVAVAVKIIHPANTARLPDWRRRWQRQAELLRSLDHPGLVKVRDVFEGAAPHRAGAADRSTRSLYLIMSWEQGASLQEWVEGEPDRRLAAVLPVIDGVAGAIDYLHSGAIEGRVIVHRDIKPANVILSADGPRLVDFGFARVLSHEPLAVVGTPSYQAPEVLAGGWYSEASDRYALGATAFFALTGHRPTPQDPALEQARLAALPEVDARPGLADDLLVMLDPDPARRPPSSRAWCQRLMERADAPPVSHPVATATTRHQTVVSPGPPPDAAPPIAVPAPPAAGGGTRAGGFSPGWWWFVGVLAVLAIVAVGIVLGLLLTA